jgi:all-trans-retinol dehydrogenase (NAD+)
MEPLAEFWQNVFLVFYYWFTSFLRFFIPKPYKNVANEVVLITGAGSGLGREMALRFGENRAKVVLVDVDEVGLKETHRQVELIRGSRVWYYVCDLMDRAAIQAMAQKTKQEVGVVTILVNNAGVVSGKTLLELSDEDIIRTIGVNTLANFWTVRAFLPDMQTLNRGHVVTLASLAGHAGNVGLTDYCASKYAAVGFTESLRMEILNKDYDIQVTEISPWFIRTGMFNGTDPGLIPMRSTASAVNAIMKGILTNEDVVFIPCYFRFLLFIKTITPFKSYFAFSRALGSLNAMATFIGRQKEVVTKGTTETTATETTSEATPSSLRVTEKPVEKVAEVTPKSHVDWPKD